MDLYHFDSEKEERNSILDYSDCLTHIHIASATNNRLYPLPDDGTDYKEFFDIRYKEKNKKLDLIKLLGVLSLLLVAMNNTFYKIDMNIVILIPLLLRSLPIIFYNDNKLYNITEALYNLGIVYTMLNDFQNAKMYFDVLCEQIPLSGKTIKEEHYDFQRKEAIADHCLQGAYGHHRVYPQR